MQDLFGGLQNCLKMPSSLAYNGKKRYGIFIMQPDGLVIYDTDPLQINKNVFTDSFFQKHPSLTAIVHRIKNETSGTGAYEFQNDMSPDLVTKVVVWNTTGLYEGAWRIVVSRVICETRSPGLFPGTGQEGWHLSHTSLAQKGFPGQR